MVAIWLSVADVQNIPDPGMFRPWWFVLMGVILLGAAVIYGVDRWRKRTTPDRLSSGDQLSQFRLLYEQGTLSREEYDRIRATLMPRLRQELNVPSRPNQEPSAPPAPEEPPPPSPPESSIRP